MIDFCDFWAWTGGRNGLNNGQFTQLSIRIFLFFILNILYSHGAKTQNIIIIIIHRVCGPDESVRRAVA
jgi:hypothetical protein